MDENKKKSVPIGQAASGEKTEAERRLEMYRKLRQDINKDNRDEKEANYQKRVT